MGSVAQIPPLRGASRSGFDRAAARREWRSHGLLVIAAMVGMAFHSVMSNALGLFMDPLQKEFGWSRSEISLGLTIAAMLSLPLSPVVGAMIDRWGSRKLAIPGVVVSAAAIASFSMLNGSVAQWLTLWFVYALVALLLKTTIWTAAVSSVFVSSRGLALAFTLSGTAIAQILVPPMTNMLVASYGWRIAYSTLAATWGAVSLVLILLFFFDARDHRRRAADRGDAPPADTLADGLTFRQALRNPPLIRIALATVIACLLNIAIIVHQVPILTEFGVSRANAAWLAGLAGVAGIVGKIVTGVLLDRVDGSWVGSVSLALPAVGFALILEPFGMSALMVLAMTLIGYATGTSLQICAYLTTRYGGMRNFGKIFGVMASFIAVGGGLGPTIAALVYDSFGSYAPLLIAGIPTSIVCGFLVLGLGPYPDWQLASDRGKTP